MGKPYSRKTRRHAMSTELERAAMRFIILE
jgi:hypothetical protein